MLRNIVFLSYYKFQLNIGKIFKLKLDVVEGTQDWKADHEFEFKLDYIVNTSSAWDAQQDLVSKMKQKTKKQTMPSQISHLPCYLKPCPVLKAPHDPCLNTCREERRKQSALFLLLIPCSLALWTKWWFSLKEHFCGF
jgi:hypothetical protein